MFGLTPVCILASLELGHGVDYSTVVIRSLHRSVLFFI